MIPATPDIWKIRPETKLKYDEKFLMLKPVNGYITGEQAKNLFLMSGLPPQILAHIWALADRDADGKMDCNEFAIAMHLIELKMKGFEIPKSLPPSTLIVPAAAFRPPVALVGAAVQIAAPPAPLPNMASGFVRPSSPVDKPQRTCSVSSQDSPTAMPPPPLIEWAVPQQAKLKFTQLFNSHDRTRTGFLTGAQAKNILVSTGLSQPVLAQIWSLSDIDGDGRLSCEEFVLAMHLAESVKAGDALPGVLPADLIPPSHRRKRSTSIQSSGSGSSHALGEVNLLGDFKEDKLLQQTTFEDKRRENFEKGQAELERRRLALLESQRKEQEERERKEREELERKERIRQEQERRRQLELEKQLAKQRELEQEKEEQRRKALEQREAARREMERQRQLEWEKQRRQELISQRQKEQEAVCHLKNLNKNLTFELEQLSNKINELNEKIADTRQRVTEVKSSIDDMRIERDTKLSDMNNVKAKIKEMNDRLLILSQEKISMKAQLSAVTQSNPTSDSYNSVMHSFGNKQVALNQLKSTLNNIENETSQKQKDIENNNTQIQELKEKLKDIAENYKNLYSNYEEKKSLFLAEKKAKEAANGSIEKAAVLDDVWGKTALAPSDTWNDNAASDTSTAPSMIKYRVLYAFEARNPDELSVMPGDIVLVPEGQSSEPGWLGGELHGKKGWFPEAYAERVEASQDAFANDDAFSNSAATIGAPAETVHIVGTEMKRTLEGISEAPENGSEAAEVSSKVLQPSENSSFTQPIRTTTPSVSSVETISPMPSQGGGVLQAQALFPWKAKKENHLTFNKGDVITVKEQQDMWWYGECHDKLGWFPKSYVKLISGPMKVSDNFLDNTLDRNEPQEPPEVNSSPPEGIPEYYVSTYAYQSQEPGDLCFEVGETILVTKKEGDWWTGTIANRTGIFPSNYVKKADQAPSVSASPAPTEPKNDSDLSFASMSIEGKYRRGEIVTVLAPYKATGPEQVSLEKGQLVLVRKKTPGGWWEGEVQVKGKKRQVGWFPASYVKELSGSRASSNRSTPEPMLYSRFNENLNGAPQQSDQVVALYPFAGQHHDELTFQKGDIITLVNTDDPSWWKGELSGATGLFPSNYVEVLLNKNPDN